MTSFKKYFGGWLAVPFVLAMSACGGSSNNPASADSAPAKPVAQQSVSGTVTGLAGKVVLQNNGVDLLPVSTDGHFSFAGLLAVGDTYAITVATQPPGQTCSVSHGNGTITSSSVLDVTVVCSVNTRTVGGTVSGLKGQLVLQDNGLDNLNVSADGSFAFPTQVAQGTPYAVTVLTQPAGQTCTVSQGSGTVGDANIQSAAVTCSDNAYRVSPTVSGLSGTVVLTNNGADNLTVSANGTVTFPTSVAQGAAYSVAVLTQPSLYTCTVTNGSGVMGAGDVTNVAVACVANTTTLSLSTTALALDVGSGSGTITVTNTGANPAFNVKALLPSGWTGVTQDTSACTALQPGATCNLTFAATTPYVAQAFSVKGDNTAAKSAAIAFTIHNLLVFAINSPSSATVLSTVLKFQTWASNNPTTTAFSLTDGHANTVNIMASTPGSQAAAADCVNNTESIPSTSGWYLPAICQITNVSGAYGSCPANTPNLDTNLVKLGFYTPNRFLWSSTVNASNNAYLAAPQPSSTTPTDSAPEVNSTGMTCVGEVAY